MLRFITQLTKVIFLIIVKILLSPLGLLWAVLALSSYLLEVLKEGLETIIYRVKEDVDEIIT